jgi:hypothetical protein
MSNEIDRALPLLQEVTELAKSEAFLSQQGSAISAYSYQDGEIGFKCGTAQDWYDGLEVENSDSDSATLREQLEEVSSCYRLVHQFGPERFEDFVAEHATKMQVSVEASPSFTSISQDIARSATVSCTLAEISNRLKHDVVSQLYAVIFARCLSLSKRHALTEAILCCYQQGGIPYGWDWEEITFISPIQD